jgi:hypothetical protein
MNFKILLLVIQGVTLIACSGPNEWVNANDGKRIADISK